MKWRLGGDRPGFGAGIDLDAKAKKNEAQEVTPPGLES